MLLQLVQVVDVLHLAAELDAAREDGGTVEQAGEEGAHGVGGHPGHVGRQQEVQLLLLALLLLLHRRVLQRLNARRGQR